jgi:DNA processing protein
MSYSIRKLPKNEFPALLAEIADPPKELFLAGVLPDENQKLLAVVGSRKYSSYGKDSCEKIIEGLQGFPITIVSGLALGIDSIAHKAALKNDLHTIAVPGSGLDPTALYPSTHIRLAEEIVSSGGALLSEYENDFRATPWSFPQRNRIMAGMSHATLIIEANEKSGTLITARLALDYNRNVLVVPGSIFSPTSKGSNELLRHGAEPATSAEDILRTLGFDIEKENQKVRKSLFEDLSPDEQRVVELLKDPMERDDLIRALDIPVSKANMILSAMELKGIIKESMGEMHLA